MLTEYHRFIRSSDSPEGLQAWKAFSLSFWDELCFGLDNDTQTKLFRAGFLRSRYSLYGMGGDAMRAYLSDFQALRLQEANAKYQTVLADHVLSAHVMANYCHVPEIYAVVTADDVQWVSLPWWSQPNHEGGKLVVHPMSPDNLRWFEVVIRKDGSFQGPEFEAHIDELLPYIQRQASSLPGSFVVTDYVQQGAFAEGLAPSNTALMNVFIVRDLRQWSPHIAAASLLITRLRADGKPALSVETGALSAKIDIESGRITACKGLDEEQRLVNYELHPDSSAPIVGQVVPNWSNVRNMLLDFFDESSYLRACNLMFIIDEGAVSFFCSSETQLAAHQLHSPLLEDPIVASHLKSLND